MTENHIYDVLIIGAGPVGLATALGLYERGFSNILVIDQTRSFRKVGQTVDLLPNGLKALKCISHQAYHNFKSAKVSWDNSSKKSVWSDRNLDGKVTRSFPLSFDYWFQQYGEGRISIHWYDIQTQLRNLLRSEMVKIDHRCINLKQYDNCVSVDCVSNQPIPDNPFAHWETSVTNKKHFPDSNNNDAEQITHSFQAKIVVAADGINSKTRQILYQNTDLEQWAKPEYSGYGAIGCLAIENIPDEIVEPLETIYLQRDRVVTIKPENSHHQSFSDNYVRMILLRKDINTFGYLLHAPIELDKILNSSPNELIQFAQQALTSAGYPSFFSQLVNLSDPKQLISRPYYIYPANPPVNQEFVWSSGRVVLAGDAAHGMPPFIAQGTNQGFEDALILVKKLNYLLTNNHLEQDATISQAFQDYEKERRPLINEIQSATMKRHLWTQAEWSQYIEHIYRRDFTP